MAGEPGEEVEVRIEATAELRVVLKERGGARPSVQQTPDPRPGDQANTEFDAAPPVKAFEELVLPPPRPEAPVGHQGEFLATREQVGSSEHGDMVVSGQLPDVLHVSHHGRVT